jgi:protein-S-isoprenylcysteine O-methyltransferase Ste14
VESDIVNQMTRWLIAAAIACVALFGFVALVAAIVFLFELPSWVEIVGGVLLALGTAAFAWLVASALESSRRIKRTSAGSESVRRIRSGSRQ